MLKRARQAAFTLMEILVAMVLIGVGIAGVAGAYLSGKRFLLQAENKTKGMDVASELMDEYLAKSFEELIPGPTGQPARTGVRCAGPDWQSDVGTVQECFADGRGNGQPFRWEVFIDELLEGTIPYKNIEVNVRYDEGGGKTPSITRVVHLENVVAYPFVHFLSAPITPGVEATEDFTQIASMTIPAYRVQKDIQVFFNIALQVANTSACQPLATAFCLQPKDSVTVRLRLQEGSNTPVVVGIESVNPVISLPIFTNVTPLGTTYFQANSTYTLFLDWRKDTPQGIVTLKEGDIIIEAIERR